MKININIENFTKFKPQKSIIRKIIMLILKNPEIFERSCLYDKTIKILSIDFVFCNDEFIHKINNELR